MPLFAVSSSFLSIEMIYELEQITQLMFSDSNENRMENIYCMDDGAELTFDI